MGTITIQCLVPSHLDGLSLGDLCEDAIETAVVADRQVAEVMVGIANDGHGGIWGACCSRPVSSDQVSTEKAYCLNLSVSVCPVSGPLTAHHLTFK